MPVFNDILFEACDNGYYGNECNNTCGYCLDLSDCFHINGTCLNGCESGYIGDLCKSSKLISQISYFHFPLILITCRYAVDM